MRLEKTTPPALPKTQENNSVDAQPKKPNIAEWVQEALNATTTLVDNHAAQEPAPFIGRKLLSQLRSIPQFAGKDISEAFYRGVPFGPKPYHRFGIFFEAESKIGFSEQPGPAQDKAAERLGAALKRATEEGISAIIADELAGSFAGYTVKTDRPENKNGTKFMDYYWDDDKGTLLHGGGQIRERTINGLPDGKFESKLAGEWIQGSPVYGRVEVSKSCYLPPEETAGLSPEEAQEKAVQKMLNEAKEAESTGRLFEPKYDENPVVMLMREHERVRRETPSGMGPALDLKTLRRRERGPDVRQQYVLTPPGAKDPKFLLTLDRVDAVRLKLGPGGQLVDGKKGHFYEIEVEQMSGSISKEELSELLDFVDRLAKQWGLIRSPGNKYQLGMAATE